MAHPVLVLEPPYDACRPLDGASPALGAILVGDLTGEEAAAIGAAGEIVRAHAAAPWCPVCLVIGPHVTNGPVLEALEPLDGSIAWIVRTAGGFQPEPALVVEAVQARPAPDAEQVSDYLRRRTGDASPGGARLADAGERVGWEWMAEKALREGTARA